MSVRESHSVAFDLTREIHQSIINLFPSDSRVLKDCHGYLIAAIETILCHAYLDFREGYGWPELIDNGLGRETAIARQTGKNVFAKN